MGIESKQNSPLVDLAGTNAIGQDGGYDGNRSGDDYSFDPSQGLSLDTMIQGNDMENAGDWLTWSAPAAMDDNVDAFSGAFDTASVSSVDMEPMSGLQRRGPPITSHPTGQRNFRRHQPHRSIGSMGFVGSLERQSSVTASDVTTPSSQHAHRNSTTDRPDDIIIPDDGAERASSQVQPESGKSDDVPPSWSELKTKAGKERKRLPLACIACRRKKIRCSGEKPACKHCLRSRIPCVYKVNTRKAAPRTDYMAMLDKRLKRMEERVIRIIPKDEQVIVSVTGRAVVKPPLPPPPPRSAGSAKKRIADQAFGDELEDWASTKPPPPATSDGQQPAQILESGGLKAKHADEHSLQHEGADKLPSKELQEHLSEVFFDYVYGQSYHLLHKPSFMRKLAQGTVPPVLMLAVCAISARFSNHPAIRTEPAFLRGEEWAGPARDIAIKRYDAPTITILIVYMILGLHEFGTCQGGRSWMLSGMAQRMAYALQLHRDLHHDPRERAGDRKTELTPTDREIRRRTMWACFLMDRFTSSGTERPIFVGEQYISAQLPIKESFFQMEVTGPTEDLEGKVPNPVDSGVGEMANAKDNMGVAAYVIRLVALLGKVIHYMNLGGKERDSRPMWEEDSKFSNLKSNLDRWKNSLPPSLFYNADNLQNHASEKIANQFLFMHITYHQILLFMHRFALPMPSAHHPFPSDVPEQFLVEAAKTARESANNISTLVHEAVDHMVVVPFVGYAAFFSSTVHIQGAFSKNPQLEAASKQYLAYNVKYLTKIKKHWGMFHFVTENLRELYRRHAEAARSGVKSGKDEESIFQYGDWFDRYPHGVSGTDYEGPSTGVKKEAGSDAVLGQKSDLQTVEEFFAKLAPPSKAAQTQQQQAARRVGKRHRSSKPEGKRPTHMANANPQKQQQQQQHQHQQQNPSSSTDQSSPHLDLSPSNQLASAQQPFSPSDMNPSPLSGYPQFSSAFPSNFQQPPNPLLLNLTSSSQQQQQQHQHPSYIPHLDRQMTLDSTTDDPSSAIPLDQQQQHQQQQLSTNLLSNSMNMDYTAFDFDTFVTDPSTSNTDFWGDQSSAWFMPFNVEPPTIGEDNNLFNGGGGGVGVGGGIMGNFNNFGDITGGGNGMVGGGGNGGVNFDYWSIGGGGGVGGNFAPEGGFGEMNPGFVNIGDDMNDKNDGEDDDGRLERMDSGEGPG